LRADTPVAKEGQNEDATVAATAVAEASVVGEATDVKPDSGSFTLEARQVYGLVPSQSSVTVVLAKGATLRSLRSSGPVTTDDLLASLKRPGVQVEAVGTFDPITATLTASRVTLNSAPVPGTGTVAPATTTAKPPVNASQL
ncbi:MAG: hypothetical protein V4671_14525, partial [Armatimonadota bacterium]